MAWFSDSSFVAAKKAPACWECAHYKSRIIEEESLHRCRIERNNDFPRAGKFCAAFRYEPGADAEEAYQ